MFLRKYATGTGADVCIPIIKRGVVDFALGADWTPATGDVKVSLDGGTAANIATLPVAIAMGNGAVWKFVFSNAELTCKSIVVTVSDSATKAVEDQAFIVETYGNASAMYVVDYSTAAFGANTTTPPTVSAVADEVQTRTIARVTLVDTTTTNTDMRGTNNAMLAASYTAPDNASITSILADTNELQTNQGNWLTATGFSTHSAADVWAVGTRSLTTFGSLVSDVATAVWAAGTRTLTAISDSSGITTLLTYITGVQETKAEADTRQTALLDAIDAIEGGGGGDTNVTVVPLTGVVESRTNGTTITAFVGETATVSIAVVDAQGASVAVTGLTLEIVVERKSLADVVTIGNGDITKTGSTISFAIPSALSSTEGDYRWSLRSAAGDAVLLQGPFIVKYAPQADS